MPVFNVGLGGSQTINQSGTDSVSFLGLGTLNIAGSAGSPIDVSLSRVGGVGALDTINITNANVTLGGVAGVSALANYNIGSGGKLTLASTVGVTAGSTVSFTAPNSELVLGNGINVNALGGIAGFAPGSMIDVSPLATSLTYADNAGTGTGGTLTLLNSSGQPVSTLSLTTGEYVGGNFHLASDGNGGTLVTVGAMATGITAAPGMADLGAGQTVTLNVSTSAPVTVTAGTPTLALNTGGIATYDPTASTPTNMVFTYTVAPGENTPALAVVGVGLNGATMMSSGSLPVDLSAVVGTPIGTLQVDTTTPTVTAVSTDPGSGTLSAGQTAMIGVGLSENVGVTGGTPTLMLSDGGVATFSPTASTPTELMFVHTVLPGQTTPDLAVVGVDLNGASVADGAGNVADLSAALTNPAGILTVGATSGTGGGTSTTGGGGTSTTGGGGTSTTGGGGSSTTGGGGTSTTGGGGIPTMGGGTAPTDGSTVSANGTASAPTVGVYRFFDGTTGTHFFTADTNERNALVDKSSASYRSDLTEETNNFGAVDPATTDANDTTVYRFFDTTHGTHFFTASQSEANGLRDPNSATYRTDLVFEPSSSFVEHAAQEAGDVPVYRFFDATYGTHFYTGSQSEYAAITTPGTASFRADLVSEGVGFYAPSGSYA